MCVHFKCIIITDVDECSAGTDNCAAEATCTNTDGSYICTCNTGYTGDGVTCTSKIQSKDVIIVHTSLVHSKCENITITTDIDECSVGVDNCALQATCTDSEGSFICACDTGYNGDGVTCNSKLTTSHTTLVNAYS